MTLTAAKEFYFRRIYDLLTVHLITTFVNNQDYKDYFMGVIVFLFF